LGLAEHGVDRRRHQLVFGREMGVEAAVGQARLGHHARHCDPMRPFGPDRIGGLLQHPIPGLLLVIAVVAHRLRPAFI
jgi:hypothetical protein